MNELGTFLRMGFEHIASAGALDHLLFLLVLVAPYRLRDWRTVAVVASAFTVGHSVTLALTVTDLLQVPTRLVEFLIPLTIVAAGLENLRAQPGRPSAFRRPLIAAGFGLIHGAGFATVLSELFVTSPAIPLLGFNLGIELGQLLVLSLALAGLSGVDRGLSLVRTTTSLRARTALASVVASGWAALMAAQRFPW